MAHRYNGKTRYRVTIEVDVDPRLPRATVNQWALASASQCTAQGGSYELVFCGTEIVEPANDEMLYDRR